MKSTLKCIIKYFNPFFYFLIALNLFMCLYMMMKYFYLKEEALELGSLSDWTIALSNIAMAYAALFAMLKASKWFDSHKQREATELAKKILYEYDAIKHQINMLRFDLLSHSNYKANKNTPLDLIKLIEDLAYRSLALQNELITIQRWGLKIKNNGVENEVKSLLEFCNCSWYLLKFYENINDENASEMLGSDRHVEVLNAVEDIDKKIISDKVMTLPVSEIFDFS